MCVKLRFLRKMKKQPISIYNYVYSCKSKNFESKNKYTMDSIKLTENLVGNNFIGVFDREYDDNKIIDYMTKHKFVIRIDDKMVFLMKSIYNKIPNYASNSVIVCIYKI